MLETTKVYLTSLLRMPALQTCLLFCKQIDTSFDFSKIVCDGWLLFEPLYPEDVDSIILKAIDLRRQWNRAVEQRVTRTVVPGETANLADQLETFFSTEITYGIKRLLPADVNEIYAQTSEPELTENPFESEFPVQSHPKKGGARVTEYLTYNCVIPNEGQDAFGEFSFLCPRCGQEETLNALQRVQHRVACDKKAPKVRVQASKGSAGYACDVCLSEFSSSVEVLRHKRTCKPSKS